MGAYFVPTRMLEETEEIKKSRFLTYLAPVKGKAALQAVLNDLRAQHPQARHCCWAAVTGQPWNMQGYACSDDGEPAGTAGRPMLQQLTGSGLGEIAAVVVRYYGGIKLGTGGLVRAYTGGIARLLPELETREVVPCCALHLRVSYDDLPACLWALEQCACEDVRFEYREQVSITALCPLSLRAKFMDLLSNQSHGRIQPSWLTELTEE